MSCPPLEVYHIDCPSQQVLSCNVLRETLQSKFCPLFAPAEKENVDDEGVEATSMASADLLTSLRCQIIMKWEEIQAIEKEIKNTMTFSGIINIKQKTVKELEVRHEV